MKHYPIPFNTEMVSAINEGRKTQTRRVVKPQPPIRITDESPLLDWCDFDSKNNAWTNITANWDEHCVVCPYGKPGDVLWVREEHLITFSEDRKWITVEFKDGTIIRWYYKDLSLSLLKKLYARKTIGKWQRARFLPKELCRLFLRVKSVRVERVQSISEEDAKAEGVLQYERGVKWLNYEDAKYKVTQFIYNCHTARESFKTLWITINGFRDEPTAWFQNPWVWVVEFERITKEEAGL